MTATNGSPVQALRIWDEGEMTLIVGGIEGAAVWLCADSAITDPALPLRIRKYQPKVEALDEFGLLGFAGPVDLGVAAISEASTHAPGRPTIELLQRINIENSRVEFLYGYLVDNEPQLARIANGEVEHSAT
ncbi:MAG TPA: hypothetical protein VL026_05875, partial [Rhizomicrobium sp.]|nr:hypothetical protein [Rhizomicrobium sp.]